MIRATNLHKVYVSQKVRHKVIDGIDLEVPKGFKLGLLGRNGAGKSTLIRLLSKIEAPTRGTVTHEMSVSWPLGFGGTFQGSLTGLDNTKFVARIYQTDYAKLRAFVDEFAELGSFLYQPVKTYSAGMRARLAFALSIAIDFDCYLIDEIVMVGDQRFHERCRQHLFDRKNDRALVLASHDVNFIAQVCDAAIILKNGRASYYGNVFEAVQAYLTL